MVNFSSLSFCVHLRKNLNAWESSRENVFDGYNQSELLFCGSNDNNPSKETVMKPAIFGKEFQAFRTEILSRLAGSN